MRYLPTAIAFILLSIAAIPGCNRSPDAMSRPQPHRQLNQSRPGTEIHTDQDDAMMSPERAGQLVARLRTRTTSTIDPGLKHRISAFISDLGGKSGFVDVNGVNYDRSTVAIWRLREMGETVVPFLLDTVTGTGDIEARINALLIIRQIHTDIMSNHDEYLAVLVQTSHDPNSTMRLAALGSMIGMAHDFGRAGNLQGRDSFVPYLCRALHDDYDLTRYVAANELWNWGRKNCIPPELIERFRLGTGDFPQLQLDRQQPRFNRTIDRHKK